MLLKVQDNPLSVGIANLFLP